MGGSLSGVGFGRRSFPRVIPAWLMQKNTGSNAVAYVGDMIGGNPAPKAAKT
jgi:hypothetical protein